MYQTDFDDFKNLISDACTAFNRPFTDDVVRVFWDALKAHPLGKLRANLKRHMEGAKKFPSPHDLKPEPEPAPPANSYTPPPAHLDNFDAFGNRCLMKFLLSTNQNIPDVTPLVREKNKLVDDFREMHREDEVTAEQMREALMRAFEKVLEHRVAA